MLNVFSKQDFIPIILLVIVVAILKAMRNLFQIIHSHGIQFDMVQIYIKIYNDLPAKIQPASAFLPAGKFCQQPALIATTLGTPIL